MRNYILFGPPGSGKGTQAKMLEQKFGLVQLSTGDIFRKEIATKSELGQKAMEYMNHGELVPDELTVAMLKVNYTKIKGAEGVIFDGFPRTAAQALALDELMHSFGNEIRFLVSLEVEREQLIERLLERGLKSGRADDANIDVIEKRLEEYLSKTVPVLKYYEKQGKVRRINGMGSIDEVAEKLVDCFQP